jgi:hypothetical protein
MSGDFSSAEAGANKKVERREEGRKGGESGEWRVE